MTNPKPGITVQTSVACGAAMFAASLHWPRRSNARGSGAAVDVAASQEGDEMMGR